ncbi:hypothetical protein ACFWGD_07575 [Corynebacterium sp. NPDC060344]|uniref:hypothetical protein n=1 Tax=Corynebacterium sp. NPDC060344 TaxID=3347101 RepID=UPI003653D814
MMLLFCLYAALLNPIPNARPETVGATALQALTYFISALCVCAAWEAVRFRAIASGLARPPSLLKLVLDRLWPLWMWTAVAFLLLCLDQGSRAGSVVVPHPLTMVLAAVLGIVWPIVGLAFGLRLPRAVGLVLAAAIPFTVTSFAWSLPDYRWRHMFGVPTGCCNTSATISSDMVLASMLCLGAIALSSIAVIGLMRGRREIPGARLPAGMGLAIIVVAGTAILGANSVAVGMHNFVAQQSRGIDEMVCSEGICHWPEATPEQIRANRAAFDMLASSMPPEWLPDDKPLIMPDQQYRYGAIDLTLEEYGPIGAPLRFIEYTDPVEIHRSYVDLLFRRVGRGDATNAEASEWWEWASRRTSPATPEEVFAWVESTRAP